MGDSAGDIKAVACCHRYFFESGLNRRDILLQDCFPKCFRIDGMLKSQVDVSLAFRAYSEDMIPFRFAAIRVEVRSCKWNGWMTLEMQPDGGIQIFQQESGIFSETLPMFFPENLSGVLFQKRGQRDGLPAELDAGNSFIRHVFPPGVVCPCRRKQPIFRKMRVGRGRIAGNFVQRPAAQIGAPHPIRCENKIIRTAHDLSGWLWLAGEYSPAVRPAGIQPS
ncbi:hypothetical protein SDC9_158547 [bioreactor metagenome]|uniref:Uncharacterized protein n=1 Tax=bioreactor metagenome TaxID=1076179 RepID=A0A645FC85_9ZZZZ